MISGEYDDIFPKFDRLHPKARFLGNSAGTIMEGGCQVTFKGKFPGAYYLTPPNMYARGLLFGSMFMELGDNANLSSLNDGYFADIEFKTKVSMLFF